MSQSETGVRFFEIVNSVVPLEDNQKSRDTALESLGMDSLDMVELVQECEDEFGIEVGDDVADKWKTLGDVLDYIQEHQG